MLQDTLGGPATTSVDQWDPIFLGKDMDSTKEWLGRIIMTVITAGLLIFGIVAAVTVAEKLINKPTESKQINSK